jgi:acetylglutamate kinase
MRDVGQRSAEVAALKHAVPYLRLFRGKTFVVKAGGGAFESETSAHALIEQIDVLHQMGIRVVLVHGGGTQSSDLLRALGGEPRFVDGRRVTDEKALEVAALVLNGAVNTRLLALCRAAGLPAVGLSGVDGGLVQARRRPPVARGAESIDYGFVGDVVAIDPKPLIDLLDGGFVPVVSPLSADDAGGLLNINADTVASALAVALGAEKLLFLTGAAGILERPGDPGSLVSYTDLAGLRRLREQGSLQIGMLPKTSAIEAALLGGVRRIHILAQDLPDGLLAEVFTNQGVGTLVVHDVGALTPAEAAAGPAIVQVSPPAVAPAEAAS